MTTTTTPRYLKFVERTFKTTGRSGDEVQCVCPWHRDSAPGHLYVNVVKGLYLCFSCGASGHVEKDGAELPPVTTGELREKIQAMRAPRQEQRLYPEGWLSQFDVPHPYWTTARGLPSDIVNMFRLGYDPFSNRVTLPLRDMHGRILGVTYRRLDDVKPKYRHPKKFPIGKHLYGAWLLTDQRKVALVEGQVDAIRCWSERVPALAMMGARLTHDQVKVLQHLNIRTVVTMTDNDESGRKAVANIYMALQGTGIRQLVGWYRPYWRNVKDPDNLTGDRLRKMYHGAMPILDWIEATGYGQH